MVRKVGFGDGASGRRPPAASETQRPGRGDAAEDAGQTRSPDPGAERAEQNEAPARPRSTLGAIGKLLLGAFFLIWLGLWAFAIAAAFHEMQGSQGPFLLLWMALAVFAWVMVFIAFIRVMSGRPAFSRKRAEKRRSGTRGSDADN